MVPHPVLRRCAFPLDELRSSGLIQASIIALALGWHFHHTPATAPALWWPYLLFAYAAMASVLPSLIGNYYDDEFGAAQVLLRGLFFALPMALAARWLAHSPYRPISLGCWVLAGLWGVYLIVSVGRRLFRRG
ncbi:MAG TPA: hypothetical protein VJ483_09640 [Holophagaceae bacterium]|nr:hypothetical protein [Holophagaceae bacterium]